MIDAAEAQLEPDPDSELKKGYIILDYAFTFLFLVELLWNMAANLGRGFFRSGWNLLDLVVE